jgi:DNA-binding MarR family transcriptional regulator
MNNTRLRSFRKHLREIERAVARHLKDQTPCCGITLAQCHVLMELEEMAHPGIAELADRLQLDASTLSRTIDGLVKSGLASRTENPQNRRSSRIALTENGVQTCHQINLVCDEFYSRLFEKIPKSQHSKLLEAIGLFSQVFSEFQTENCWKHSLKNLPEKEGDRHGKKCK